MDSGQARMAEFLRANQSAVLDQWSAKVSASVGDRVSVPELRRELDELYALILRSIAGEDESATGELRAVLAELSPVPGPAGFSLSETALGIFSLKDAVYNLVADASELVPEFLAFSRTIDAECIVTGIRPQIARTIVSLGIEFGDVPTKQTLADGRSGNRRPQSRCVQRPGPGPLRPARGRCRPDRAAP